MLQRLYFAGALRTAFSATRRRPSYLAGHQFYPSLRFSHKSASTANVLRYPLDSSSTNINISLGAAVKPKTCIPVINFDDPFYKIASEVNFAASTSGFFYVVNHGVSADLQAEMFAMSKQFFDLPHESKAALSTSSDSPKRGYFAFEREHLNFEEDIPNYKGDYKEGFDMGYDSSASKAFFGSRQFPSEELVPGFQDASERYMSAMRQYTGKLMQVFAAALGLPPSHFDQHITDPLSTLRLLHYRNQEKDFDIQRGCAAHTDYGTCTALLQDEVGGLQIRLEDGSWRDVVPIPGSYVTNLGDMLQLWSAGRWRSTVHRVVNVSGSDRYSIPFFFNPNGETIINPLVSKDNKRNTCADHLSKKYKKSRL